MNNNTVSISI